MKTLKLQVSDKQVEDFVNAVDADSYTVYEAVNEPELNGIYFLGSNNTSAQNEPFENLTEDGESFVRLISKEKSDAVKRIVKVL